MALNRNVTAAKAVIWNGEEAARVRGLSSNDLAAILEREGTGLRSVLDTLDEVDLKDIAEGDHDKIAGKLIDAGPAIVVQLSKTLPHFLATIIVVASNGEDEDVEYVADEWPIALQFLALTEIATLTFSGVEGFRSFVGNAFALVGLAKTLTGADKNIGKAEPQQLENGATPSSS